MLNRLFCGGLFMIGIESIRLISSNKNFEAITQTLYCFDAILSNAEVAEEVWKKIGSSEVNILRHLISNYLNNNNDYKKIVDSYIYNTFHAFITNKKEIKIKIWRMQYSEVNKEMIDLIMNPLESDYPRIASPRSSFSNINLFKKELLQIFKYAKKIIFYTDTQYRICLYSLASIISGSSLDQIILELGEQRFYDDYISKQYVITSSLRSKYNDINYNISDLIQESGEKKRRVWCIISAK